MKKGFIPGAVVRAKTSSVMRGEIPETATIVRYDGERFYIVRTERSPAFVVHEDDIELVPSAEVSS